MAGTAEDARRGEGDREGLPERSVLRTGVCVRVTRLNVTADSGSGKSGGVVGIGFGAVVAFLAGVDVGVAALWCCRCFFHCRSLFAHLVFTHLTRTHRWFRRRVPSVNYSYLLLCTASTFRAGMFLRRITLGRCPPSVFYS